MVPLPPPRSPGVCDDPSPLAHGSDIRPQRRPKLRGLPHEPEDRRLPLSRQPPVSPTNNGTSDPEPLRLGRPRPNCSAARADGAAPVRSGDPGYGPHLDRDRDGNGVRMKSIPVGGAFGMLPLAHRANGFAVGW